jgi:hypothetical protein
MKEMRKMKKTNLNISNVPSLTLPAQPYMLLIHYFFGVLQFLDLFFDDFIVYFFK